MRLREELREARRGLAEANDRVLCVLCTDAERACAFVPCKHAISCRVCLEKLKEEAKKTARLPRCPIYQEILWNFDWILKIKNIIA